MSCPATLVDHLASGRRIPQLRADLAAMLRLPYQSLAPNVVKGWLCRYAAAYFSVITLGGINIERRDDPVFSKTLYGIMEPGNVNECWCPR
jgi:hypothetical protein